MSPKKSNKLVEKYPHLFKDLYWGFQCHDGWFDLIDVLAARISSIDTKKQIKAAQVKEKLGGLRFYIHPVKGNRKLFDEVLAYVHFAEAISYRICERTGNRGRLYCTETGWYTTTNSRFAKKHNLKEIPERII